MKYRSIISIVLVLKLLFISSSINAQWQACRGLEGGSTSSIISSDSVVLLAAKNEVYRCDSFNAPWELSVGGRGSFLKAGNYVFKKGPHWLTNLMRTDNWGIHWEEPPVNISCSDACRVDTVLFSNDEVNIVRSFDYMNSFEYIPDLPLIEAQKFLSDDSLVLIIDELSFTFYKSIDLGDTWDTITTNGINHINNYSITDLACFDDKVFLSSREGMFYFDNLLDFWIKIPDPDKGIAIYSLLEKDGQVFGSSDSSGILIFNKNNYSWEIYHEFPYLIYDFSLHQGGFICASKAGPYLLSGNNWIPYLEGIYTKEINSISILNDSVYVFADNELYKSTEQGDNFTKINSINGKKLIISDSAFYYISGTHFIKTGPMFSNVDSIEIPDVNGLEDFYVSSDYYWLQSYSDFYRSRKDTLNWVQLSNGISGGYINSFAVWDSIVLLNDYLSGGVFISNDYGDSFQLIFESDSWNVISLIDQTFYILFDDSVYSSHDMCESWEAIFPEIPQGYSLESIDVIGDKIVLGGSTIFSTFVTYSPDAGQSWFDISSNLPSVLYPDVGHIKIIGNRVLASTTDNSLWVRDDVLTIEQERFVFNKGNENLKLYPNPCKDEIHIEIKNHLKNGSIQVFDLQGNLLLSKVIKQNTMSMKLAQFSTGVYIIKITCGQKQTLDKLIKL